MPIYTKYSKTKKYDEPLYSEPQSTEEISPVKAVDESGVFTLNENRYSMLFELTDIDFAGLSDIEQKEVIINLSDVLNAMTYRFSFTIANDYVDSEVFGNQIMYQLRGDELDDIRKAFNDVINKKVSDARQGLYKKIYLTLTMEANSLAEARQLFENVEMDLSSRFIEIGVDKTTGTVLRPVNANEHLQLWYDFMHSGQKSGYKIDFKRLQSSNKDWIDVVSPESLRFYNDYFILNGNRYGRCLYISKHPKKLSSDIISYLTRINAVMYISINSEILDPEGYKMENLRKLSSVGTKINKQKESNRKKNDYLSDASEVLLTEKEQLNDLSDDIANNDDKYFNTTIMIMYLARDLDELEKITGNVKTIAGVKSFEVKPCFGKQREGINSSFMFGVQEFKRVCNFSSPCQSMYMPFNTKELTDFGGIYYGINQFSLNPIIADRKKLPAGHGLIFGTTGFGKSVYSKCEIISNRCVFPEDNVIIIDPNNEYKSIANIEAIKGAVISFDPNDNVYVNPLDVDFENVNYTELQQIIGDKTDFVLTLLGSFIGRELDSIEQGIINDVVEKVFSENYSLRKRMNGDKNVITDYDVPQYMLTKEAELPITSNMSYEEQERRYSPTLQDVYQKLMDMEGNKTANLLAQHLHIFVNGSLNYFNHKTNIDLHSKFLVFNILNSKDNLIIPTMLVMLEIIRNKLRTNFRKEEWTHIYIDEFHNLLKIPVVSSYVLKQWKEARKFYGTFTGITQNLTDLINDSANSAELTGIFDNTRYFAFLKLSMVDINILQTLLPDISHALYKRITGAKPGTGLIYMDGIAIPFDNRMPKDCSLYGYVNTSKKEDSESEENFDDDIDDIYEDMLVNEG